MVNGDNYLSNLTPLRGIAALLTVLYHVDVMFAGGGMLIPSASGIGYRMYLMVDFFFILSGFIMLHVYGAWFSNKVTWETFRKFFRARLARIYPLHILMLGIMMGLLYYSEQLGQPKEPALEIENNWYSVITNIFLLHSMNIHSWYTWVHASWSISTEWWMYMVFPFLVIPVVVLKNWGKWITLLLAFGAYWLITMVLLPLVTAPPQLEYLRPSADLMTINVGFQYGFIRCAAGFIIGMLTYRWYAEKLWRNLLGNGYVLCALFAILLTSLHFQLPDALSVMLFPLILLSAAYGSSGINKIFTTRPFQRLGDWSYSIYLSHQPIIIFIIILILEANPPKAGETFLKPPAEVGWILALVVVILTLAFSALLHRFWEKPLRKLINPDFGQ